VEIMTAVTLPESDRISSKAWMRHGLVLAALLLLTVAAFLPTVEAAVQVWWISPTYSHCFLILPIIGWLVWEKRPTLALMTPGLEPRALILLPLFGLTWWLGELAAINEVQQYSVVGILQVLIVALLGRGILRVIWFPVLYLLFLVPTGEYLIVPMQHFATVFVDISLNLLGIIHYTEGTTFELTNGRFEIAEACAGLRFLIATVTLGVLYSYMMFKKPGKAALFLIACVGVPLIGNGLRCVGIILLAHFTDNKLGAGADHLVYGWGFNVAILLVLGVLGSLFRDDMTDKHEVRITPAAPVRNLAIVAALAAGFLWVGPALAAWHDNNFTQPDIAAMAEPLHPVGWREDLPSTSWRPNFSGLDAETVAALVPVDEAAATPVQVFVGYYALPRPGHAITARINRLWDEPWTLSETHPAKATLAGKSVEFQESIISSGFEKRIIWSSYWIDGRFTPGMFRLKLLQPAAALQGHEGQAVVAVSTPVEGTVEEARARLSRLLAVLDEVPARLDRANHRALSSSAEGAR
jgi:exosortase A